jgi:hypothetical protein
MEIVDRHARILGEENFARQNLDFFGAPYGTGVMLPLI